MPGKISVSIAGASCMPLNVSTGYKQAQAQGDYQKLRVSFCGFKLVQSVPFRVELEHTQDSNDVVELDYKTGFRLLTDDLKGVKLHYKLSGETIKKVYDNLGRSIKNLPEKKPSSFFRLEEPTEPAVKKDPYLTSVKIELYQNHDFIDWFDCDRHEIQIWAS